MNSYKVPICAVCNKRLSRSKLRTHIIEVHKLTYEEYYCIKYPDCNKSCKFCKKTLLFRSPNHGGYGTYCDKVCWGRDNTVKGTNAGASKGGKRSHKLHPGRTTQYLKKFIKEHPEHAKNLGKKYGPIYGPKYKSILKIFTSDSNHQKMARRFQDIRHPGLAVRRAQQIIKNNPHIKEKLKLYIKEHPDHQSKAGRATQRKYPHVKNNAFNGKIRPVYKRVKMRSSWETRFAELCDKNRVNWEYEPKRFTLSNNGSYTPDFYLKDFELWVEIKPKVRQTEKALNKLKQLPNSSKILDLSEFESFFKTLLNQ